MIEMSKSAYMHEPESSEAFTPLQAGGRVLDCAPTRMGALVPTLPKQPLGDLIEQYKDQGYLWLKGFFDPEMVLAFRGRVLSHLGSAGLIAAGTDPRIGICSPQVGGKADIDRRLMEIVRSAAFESFCTQPELVAFMDAFLGGLSYIHKRKIMRYTRPGSSTFTPAHYDLVYLRGGTHRIVTAWIPIGDIPRRMGGLVYLEGSHAIGVKMEQEFAERAAELSPQERINAFNKHMTEGRWVSKDLPDMAQRFDSRWLVADFEAGDLMLHSPYMIHASTDNQDVENRIRLSTDLRYQDVQSEIDARWSNHWSLDDML